VARTGLLLRLTAARSHAGHLLAAPQVLPLLLQLLLRQPHRVGQQPLNRLVVLEEQSVAGLHTTCTSIEGLQGLQMKVKICNTNMMYLYGTLNPAH
jgi:hypothetical protein